MPTVLYPLNDPNASPSATQLAKPAANGVPASFRISLSKNEILKLVVHEIFFVSILVVDNPISIPLLRIEPIFS